MKILFVHPDYDKAALISTQCQTEIESEFVIVNSAAQGQTLFLQSRDFDLVILYDPNNQDCADRLHNIILKRYKETHIIHFTDSSTKDRFPYRDDLSYLIATTKGYLEALNKLQHKEYKKSDYIKLHIEFLENFKQVPTEISILINDKYVRILNKNDTLTDSLIQKYKDKKIKYVYLSKLDRKIFVQTIASTFESNLNSPSKEIDPEQVKETIYKLLSDIGISPEVTTLANQAVEAVIHKMQTMPNIQQALQELFKNPGGFRFKFNYMTGMLAFTLLNDPSITWASESNKEAMIQASLFNDTLLEQDEWVKVRTEEDLQKLDVTEGQKDDIRKHALMTSVEYKRAGIFPPEASKIIKHHHGNSNGVGFNKDITLSPLSPLSYYYIVAEEFSFRVLTSENKKVHIKKIIQDIEEYFNSMKINSITAILKKNLNIS